MDYKRVLVLRYTNGMSSREIAETTGDGKTTIDDFLKRFRECEALTYPLSEVVFYNETIYCMRLFAAPPLVPSVNPQIVLSVWR